MKFLVDAKLTDRVARFLEDADHEAIQVNAPGVGHASDAEICYRAFERGAVIVSGALISAPCSPGNTPHCGR